MNHCKSCPNYLKRSATVGYCKNSEQLVPAFYTCGSWGCVKLTLDEMPSHSQSLHPPVATECSLCNRNPSPAVDIVVYHERTDSVLIIERKNAPHGFALVGGFIDYGETAEQAAVRELKEEAGITLSVSDLKLVGVFSDPKRDPRKHIMSIVYTAFYEGGCYDVVAGDDAKAAYFVRRKKLPQLVNDHDLILAASINILNI